MYSFGKFANKIFLSIGLGALIYLALSIYADLRKLKDSLNNFEWRFIPVILVLALMNYLIRFIKWHYYLKILGIELDISSSMKIFFSGLSMTVTPGKFGEVLKSFLLKQSKGTPISISSPIVLAERFTDLLSLIFLSFVGIFSPDFGYKVTFISLAICVGFLVLIGSKRASLGVINWLGSFPLMAKISAKLHHFYNSTYMLVRIKPLIIATFISALSWLCECIGFYLTIQGFQFAKISIYYAIFVYSFSTIAGAITMLPGGIGLTEISMAGLLIAQGMEKATGTATTLIIRACTLWFAVLVGAIAIIIGQVNLSAALAEEDGSKF